MRANPANDRRDRASEGCAWVVGFPRGRRFDFPTGVRATGAVSGALILFDAPALREQRSENIPCPQPLTDLNGG